MTPRYREKTSMVEFPRQEPSCQNLIRIIVVTDDHVELVTHTLDESLLGLIKENLGSHAVNSLATPPGLFPSFHSLAQFLHF